MARYDKDHKPTGDAAKAATLPDGFALTRGVFTGARTFGPGDEEGFAATKPSVADVDRLTASGALTMPAGSASAKAKK